ncbi:UNVERIFIED_ORG: DNA-binding transcriptional MerR regulator [Arthrobacter sp. UYEF2]
MAAKLAGTGQQNIRLYETKGLILPERTAGGTRKYSDADVALLLHIGELLDQGLNLAGIAKVLALEVANAELRLALRRVRPRQEA